MGAAPLTSKVRAFSIISTVCFDDHYVNNLFTA